MFAAVRCPRYLMLADVRVLSALPLPHTRQAPLQRAETPAVQQRGLNREDAALPQSSGCGCGVARDAVRQTVRTCYVAAAGRCQGCCGCGVPRDAAAAALPGMPCARPCTVPAPCRPRSAPEHFRSPSATPPFPCAVSVRRLWKRDPIWRVAHLQIGVLAATRTAAQRRTCILDRKQSTYVRSTRARRSVLCIHVAAQSYHWSFVYRPKPPAARPSIQANHSDVAFMSHRCF